MSSELENDVKPVVLRSSQGDVVAAALQNAKAFRKSLENNELWVYQPEGGRVLPYDKGSISLQELRDCGAWYEAVVLPAGNGSTEGGNGAMSPSEPQRHAAQGSTTKPSAANAEPVLERLAQLISARRRDLPEGSYTSYLFREGEDKIRKKTGEEAIELILARTSEDIRNEAADLIYHLLVLLEVSDIPLQAVIDVLRGRE
ncbi:MAG: phosphoribosyl-ATP diphosphatase [Spirochaeta sp.]|nr:phosphoribosyl-ATP diphosphatase [Spirochaeta sp.]